MGADIETAASYPEDSAVLIDNVGYTKEQILSVDETDLHWKRVPFSTFMTRKKFQCLPSKILTLKGLTLLLRDNADGDFRLYPILIYHSEILEC